MSADSPRRSGSRVTRQGGGSVCGNGGGQVVVPQPVTDPSIIDSVTGFINDVVPQAYTSTLPGDFKETITWARFESADINDPALFPDNTSDAVLPLILILGYNTGVQVWAIPANGEASEVLSWSQGSVRTLRILPSPISSSVRCSDSFAMKRPLVAICDSAGPGPPFCSVSFISLKTGDQVKSIKFKNPVCDVYANRRSVIVTFPERIAVFDACTLEDRLSITSCFPSPGPNANPVALGSRWLAFAEKKLIAWQRSSGGVGGAGAQSYTATVLHAAQTLGRGLRGLSETVASSLTGPRNHIGGQMGILGSSPPTMNGTEHSSPGIVTVLDLEASTNRYNSSEEGHSGNTSSAEGVIAHFIAHSKAIVALEFDPSGTLILTADKRGHDFHVFRLQPHPSGSSLAAVHHLYVLHRGDTTAKVQNVAFSCDSRWVAVSTMRGTTHVFPLTPYGGPVGFRTHGSPLVVNRLSRFHRSAGLSADGRSSPVPSPESPPCLPAGPHANPRLPPYPHPAVQAPLAQLRQSPHPPLAPAGTLDVSLRVCATFASPRAWLLDSQTTHPRDGPRDSSKVLRRAVDSIFVMACHGNLVQYDLDPKPVISTREKICDDTQIELDVEAKAQWLLQRSPHSPEVLPPLPSSNPLLCGPDLRAPTCDSESNGQLEERWLSQVEIITHAGPHRRLWMGPQITFKTYTTTSSGSNVSLQDVEAVEVGTVPVSRPARSNPVNMPSGGRPVVPVLIESGSGSSFEQSPHLLEVYGADSGEADHWGGHGHGDSRLREDLADAMLESPGAPSREKGKRRYYGLVGGGGGDGVGEGRVVRGGGTGPVRRVVNPGGAQITMLSDGEESDKEPQVLLEHHWEAIAIPATAPVIPDPPAPDSDSSPREMVTTIAAARLQRLPVQLVNELPPKPVEKNISGENHYQGLDWSSISSSHVVGGTAQSTRKPSVTSGAGEKDSCVEKSSQSSLGVSCDTHGSTAEKAVQYCREGSIEKGDTQCEEVVKPKVRMGTDNTEPPPVRKKNKKNVLLRELEMNKKSDVGVVETPEGQKGEKLLADTNVDKDVFTGVEPTQTLSGKKGKKAVMIQENSQDDVSKLPQRSLNRKSPSPQKDLAENKSARKSSVSSEKDITEDLPSISVRKNKKKSSCLSKETSKKDENNVETPVPKDSKIALPSDKCPSNNENLDTGSDHLVHRNNPSDKEDSNNIVTNAKNGSKSSTKFPPETPDVEDIVNEVEHDSNVNDPLFELSHELKVCVEMKDRTASEEPLILNTSKSKRKSLKSARNPVEEVPHESDLLVNEVLPQNLSKSSQKSIKRLQKSEDEACPLIESATNNLMSGKDESHIVAKTSKKSSKVERGDKLGVVEAEITAPEKEINAVVKTIKSKIKESDVATVREPELVKSVQQIEADAALDDSACTLLQNKDKGLASESAVDANKVMEPSASDSPVSVRSGKKGQRLAKTFSSDVDSRSTRIKNEPESVTASIWNIQSNLGQTKDTDNFPALSSKYSKKTWGITHDDTTNVVQVDEKHNSVADIAKKSETCVADSERDSSIGAAEVEASKAKRGWEVPVNVNSKKSNTSDMDIDKLTFEDLEAIVDAACKEEETKIDQTCLKENKKGKKNDANLSHSPKTKGKENIKEGVSDGGNYSDLSEVIEVPKPTEEVMKQEEPVKSPEKPVSTPNKSSKAQRRKRR